MMQFKKVWICPRKLGASCSFNYDFSTIHDVPEFYKNSTFLSNISSHSVCIALGKNTLGPLYRVYYFSESMKEKNEPMVNVI